MTAMTATHAPLVEFRERCTECGHVYPLLDTQAAIDRRLGRYGYRCGICLGRWRREHERTVTCPSCGNTTAERRDRAEVRQRRFGGLCNACLLPSRLATSGLALPSISAIPFHPM